MFFSCVRHRGGWNNNPSALQFRYAYRSLLVHADVRAPDTGNVAPDVEGTLILPHLKVHQNRDDEQCDDSHEEAALATAAGHDYANLAYGLSNFSSEVVQYIGGFIVRVVAKKITCSACTGMLVKDNITSILIFIRNNGGLIMPSEMVHHTLHTAEYVLRQSLGHVQKVTADQLTLLSFRQFCERHEKSLGSLEHYRESPEHVIALIKFMLKTYIALRLREHSRRVTEQTRGAYVRAQLTKQILFQHQ